jgi:hypothetical protein
MDINPNGRRLTKLHMQLTTPPNRPLPHNFTSTSTHIIYRTSTNEGIGRGGPKLHASIFREEIYFNKRSQLSWRWCKEN